MDLDPVRCQLAQQFGANVIADSDRQMADLAAAMTAGHGVDAVIITAATKSSAPIGLAGRLCREKGRVVVVGAVPLNVPRKEYYEKELDLCISRAFGPGTYDKKFVEEGVDYPYGYVRWTAQRNMEAFLNLFAEGQIRLDSLITHRFPIDDAPKAYDLLYNPQEQVLGILFQYDTSAVRIPQSDAKVWLAKDQRRSATISDTSRAISSKSTITLGFIGAGNFAQAYLLPNFRRLDDVTLRGVATATSVSATNTARKFGFDYCTCNYQEILKDSEINCVVIATRHNLHASLTTKTLRAGKNVYVEKPLCLNETELDEIITVYNQINETNQRDQRNQILMVGFNRRFSPFIQELKKFLIDRTGPVIITYRVNAGYVPSDHWIYNPMEGGGRILGEVCHFVDLLQYLTGARSLRVFAQTTHTNNGHIPDEDNVQVTISFADGSTGTIVYTAAGDLSFPRERLEVFADGSVGVVDNFRQAVFTRHGRIKKMRRWSQDMGHRDEIATFVAAVQQGGPAPIQFEEIVLTTLTTLKIKESLMLGVPVEIAPSRILTEPEPVDQAEGFSTIREGIKKTYE
jgi:predicted dehydrogenase